MPSSPAVPHAWKFFRTGGLDQVTLETGADLLNLENLDQKLWVALSCPVKGLELDEKTLALIDSDGDGRIRVPELIAAVNPATAEGKLLASSAQQILRNLGMKDAAIITVAQAADTASIFSASALN